MQSIIRRYRWLVIQAKQDPEPSIITPTFFLSEPLVLMTHHEVLQISKRPSSVAAVPQNANPTPLLGYLVRFSDRILFISSIWAATFPLSYYLICYFY
ncbi:hypothetical protein BDV41DRAFT_531092 [Aspergillus transmontanensis]|uniref:Uncharacterized protein n=1 Tax=Aspergillus transmontanensis TaxID=1034304 RepID=A0A5N6W3K1_9EURO|nr:hypothetical protein BDV41DRAFT_531092 [Aspergillus transmontanensis]